MKAIALETWAGRRYCQCEVVGETPSRYRVMVLATDGVQLPGGQHYAWGQVASVPKHAVHDVPDDTEADGWGEAVEGYGVATAPVPARKVWPAAGH